MTHDLSSTHAGLPARSLAWLRQWRERRQLLGLSDRTLDDLGLTRADVEGACSRAVPRQPSTMPSSRPGAACAVRGRDG